uniref:Uncharacterized protein n=1 Tax=Arundo donax TaxID=35708 RepID=A0A0A8Z8U4_ARUDO
MQHISEFWSEGLHTCGAICLQTDVYLKSAQVHGNVRRIRTFAWNTIVPLQSLSCFESAHIFFCQAQEYLINER